MSAVDPPALAQAMQALMPAMDRACRPVGFQQHRFDAPPCGTAYVIISPAEQHQHASSNQNRIHLCGGEGGLGAEGLDRLIGLFAGAGVARFNVWMSPGPDMESVRRWLAAAGMTRVPWVSYLTLAREALAPPSAATDLVVREVTRDELAARAGRLNDVAWPDYLRAAGTAGYHHFMAFDGDEPAAGAALHVADGLGYLGMALTAERFRRRGAQAALIAARIAKARALGCTLLVSETLNILKSSLGNLQRAGFTLAYEREVYQPAEAASTRA